MTVDSTPPKPRSDLPKVGEQAPDFTAMLSDGSQIRLADFRGKQRVALIFYPGDFTPVCTTQLCNFRDNWDSLKRVDAVVFGVNSSSAERHEKFTEHIKLPFKLISDKKSEVAAAYGCSAIFGLMTRRAVVVIDRQGKVVYSERGMGSPDKIVALLETTDDNASEG